MDENQGMSWSWDMKESMVVVGEQFIRRVVDERESWNPSVVR